MPGLKTSFGPNFDFLSRIIIMFLFSAEGTAYFETIACSVCLAFYAFHAPYAKALLGKQVRIVISS